MRRRQLDERLLVAGCGRAASSSMPGATPASGGGGAELRPRRRLERAGPPAERDEADPVRPGQDPPQLLRADAGHHPRHAARTARSSGDERRRAGERDVDLLLVRVERVGVVVVLRIAVPVRAAASAPASPTRYAERRPRPARKPAVDRLHLVDRRHRHVNPVATFCHLALLLQRSPVWPLA